MFRLLFLFQTRVLGVVAAATAMVCFTVLGFVWGDQNEQETRVEQSEQEAHFWGLVAGEFVEGQTNVRSLLVRDLQGVVGDTELINRFRVPANRYGGIEGEVGFDPFDGDRLSDHTKAALEAIDEGQLGTFIATDVVVSPPDEHVTVTPFGISWLLFGFILVTLVGSATFLIGQFDYRLRPADWNGESTWHKWPVILLAWPVALPAVWRNRKLAEEREARMRELFPSQMGLIDLTGRIIKRYPDDPDLADIRDLRSALLAEIKRQSKRDELASDVEVQSLAQSLRDSMETLEFRAGVMEELEE